MIKYIVQCLTTKYSDFDGRASLAEFISYWLFVVSLMFSITFPFQFLTDACLKNIIVTICGITFFLLLSPSLAVTVRRLHDGDVSGWMILLVFAGCPGIFLIFLLAIIGDHDCRNDNQYGPALPENTGKWNEDDENEDEKNNFIKI